jgi:hypothetical protein
MLNSAVVVLVTGKHTINIEGDPTRTEWFVLFLIVLVLPVAATIGWLVSRISTVRGRTVTATVAVLIAIAGGVLGGPSPRILVDLIFEAVAIGIILALTASGVGSILGLAVSTTFSHLAEAGSLLLRALPVLLLTFLVFFNSPVWLMASAVTRPRLWLAILFLAAIAAAFVVSVTVDRVRPIMSALEPSPDRATRLSGTPFATMQEPSEVKPLNRSERLNVYVAMAIAQLSHILVVAVVTALLFFVLGLILLSPEVLTAWTRNGSSDGQFLGMTIPVPQALIQITLFLSALTFMYISARAVGDDAYRAQFFDPLTDELRVALDARRRYRAAVPAR